MIKYLFVCLSPKLITMSEIIDNNNDPIQEEPGIGWQILAFLIPLAGIIMYFNQKSTHPNKAKRYIMLAGIGIAINLILRFIIMSNGA